MSLILCTTPECLGKCLGLFTDRHSAPSVVLCSVYSGGYDRQKNGHICASTLCCFLASSSLLLMVAHAQTEDDDMRKLVQVVESSLTSVSTQRYDTASARAAFKS